MQGGSHADVSILDATSTEPGDDGSHSDVAIPEATPLESGHYLAKQSDSDSDAAIPEDTPLELCDDDAKQNGTHIDTAIPVEPGDAGAKQSGSDYKAAIPQSCNANFEAVGSGFLTVITKPDGIHMRDPPLDHGSVSRDVILDSCESDCSEVIPIIKGDGSGFEKLSNNERSQEFESFEYNSLRDSHSDGDDTDDSAFDPKYQPPKKKKPWTTYRGTVVCLKYSTYQYCAYRYLADTVEKKLHLIHWAIKIYTYHCNGMENAVHYRTPTWHCEFLVHCVDLHSTSFQKFKFTLLIVRPQHCAGGLVKSKTEGRDYLPYPDIRDSLESF